MTSTEDRVRVASRISKELDVRLRQFYVTSSSAIPEALELLASAKEGNDVNDDDRNEHIDDSLTSPQIEEMKGRIDDLRTQVQALYSQLHTKDEQIEKLNENMHKQAVHTQSLIQEISRLNIKSLPEAPAEKEVKKKWYEFWK